MRNQSSHFRTDWTHSFSTSEVRRQRHRVLETCAPSAKTWGVAEGRKVLHRSYETPSSHHSHAVRISWKTGKECRRVHEGFRSTSSSISRCSRSCNGHHLQVPVEPQEEPKQYNQVVLFFFCVCDFGYFLRCCPFLLTSLPPLKQPSEGLTLPWHPVVSGLLPKCKPVRALRAQDPSLTKQGAANTLCPLALHSEVDPDQVLG